MNLAELQPYLTAISASLVVATFLFLLNVVKAVRENALDSIAVQEERLKRGLRNNSGRRNGQSREERTSRSAEQY